MPHVIFELSDNIIEKDLSQILAQIHQILTDTLPTKLESCKSRVLRYPEFLVGNGNSNNAFIHLSIAVLSGRTREILDLTVNKITVILQNNFKESREKLNLNISVSISDLPAMYYKI